jgi:hypothetical protein
MPGPRHNQIAPPADGDNSTIWRADFSRHYFEELFDGDGESMRTYYEGPFVEPVLGEEHRDRLGSGARHRLLLGRQRRPGHSKYWLSDDTTEPENGGPSGLS